MAAFAAMVDALFASASMAVDASYVPVAGDPATVRVIRKSPDEITPFGAGRILSETTLLDARVADLPNPAPGDLINIGPASFIIQGEPKLDRERLIWTLDMRLA